jgi:hypothetical protein
VDSILTCPHELSPHLEHVMHYLSPQEFKYWCVSCAIVIVTYETND